MMRDDARWRQRGHECKLTFVVRAASVRWFNHSTISWVVFANKIKNIALQKEPIFLLNGEVIWQASDSPLSKELHGSILSHLKR